MLEIKYTAHNRHEWLLHQIGFNANVFALANTFDELVAHPVVSHMYDMHKSAGVANDLEYVREIVDGHSGTCVLSSITIHGIHTTLWITRNQNGYPK